LSVLPADRRSRRFETELVATSWRNGSPWDCDVAKGLLYPYGIGLDASGNIYVTDAGNSLQDFGSLPTSARLTTWGGLKALYR
jgi:DNA-binding beta-propeller fold protein YncE